MQNTTAIYGLVHPLTGELRYIGKSNDPEKRYAQHCASIRYAKYKHVWITRWIAKLHRQGLKPEMIILEQGGGDFWREAEGFWIEYMRSLGCSLLNITPGGIGPSTANVTPHMRRLRAKGGRAMHAKRDVTRLPPAWKLLSPQGEEFLVVSLDAFAKERGLQSSNLTRVASGKRKQHKGWRCERIPGPAVVTAPNEAPIGLRWTVESPVGDRFTVGDLKAFALQHPELMKPDRLAGKTRAGSDYKGWRAWRTSEAEPTRIPAPPRAKKPKAEKPPREPKPPSAPKTKKPRKLKPLYHMIRLEDGQKFSTRNVTRFCREHDLIPIKMFDVANGKRTQHKGWICFKDGAEPRFPQKPLPRYSIIDEDGIRYEVAEVSAFAQAFGVIPNNLTSLLRAGGETGLSGWRCYRYGDPRANNPTKALRITDPQGLSWIVHNVKAFAEARGIDYKKMHARISGVTKHTLPGWAFEEALVEITKIIYFDCRPAD